MKGDGQGFRKLEQGRVGPMLREQEGQSSSINFHFQKDTRKIITQFIDAARRQENIRGAFQICQEHILLNVSDNEYI